MKDIFISYSSKEYNDALKYRDAFISKGIDCWMAPGSIAVGSSYAIEIPKAIRNCKIVVFVMSEKSQSSTWVQKEIGLAISYNKPVIPVVIDNCSIVSPFDFFLTDVQMVPATENPEQLVTIVCEMVGLEPSKSEIIENISKPIKSTSSDVKTLLYDKLDALKSEGVKTIVNPIKSKIEQIQQNYTDNKGNASDESETDISAHWFCSQCGTSNLYDYLFCKNCGGKKPISWICEQCGSENFNINHICFKCGVVSSQNEKIDEDAKITESVDFVNTSEEYINTDEITEKETTIDDTYKNTEVTKTEENLWFCGHCGTSNVDNYAFCKSCGTKKPVGWICEQCGSENFNSNHICYKCSVVSSQNEKIDEDIKMTESVDFANTSEEYINTDEITEKETTIDDTYKITEVTKTEENVWFCGHCGTSNFDNYAFCKSCGTKKPVGWICEQCGSENFNSNHICYKCSAGLTVKKCTDKTLQMAEQLDCIPDTKETINSNKIVSSIHSVIDDTESSVAEKEDESIWICAGCGEENHNILTFCKKCGEAKPFKWICTVCKKENLNNTYICSNCKLIGAPHVNSSIEWFCPYCSTINPKFLTRCSKCNSDKINFNSSSTFRYNDGMWGCKKCGTYNSKYCTSCTECGERKK